MQDMCLAGFNHCPWPNSRLSNADMSIELVNTRLLAYYKKHVNSEVSIETW